MGGQLVKPTKFFTCVHGDLSQNKVAATKILVSSPDPTLCEGKGLGTNAQSLGCADSAVLFSVKTQLLKITVTIDNIDHVTYAMTTHVISHDIVFLNLALSSGYTR